MKGEDQFRVVSLQQGTPEWIEWRHKGIGASDAPIIMGENPWKFAAQLLAEKRGLAKQGEMNAAMARGTQLEPEARAGYTKRTQNEVNPACLQHIEIEWLKASVDGICSKGETLVEIKCGESVYRKTSMTGRVPGYYYGQLQHVLLLTGNQAIDFWCYLPGRPEILVKVQRDEEYIARLLEKEQAFWEEVKK